MSYYFIEHRNPTHDHVIDLNFDNDILYGSLTDDVLDKCNTRDNFVVSNETVSRPSKNKGKLNKKNKSSSNTIYVIFIIIVIILIVLWYVFGSKNEIKQKDIIDTYPDQPELTMLSPDIGMNSRFGTL